ncbi:MAG: GIY-YIG nuclease family protein [Candidatus Pacebacteria bacterium]|nr:GIY-YIG nuclease family protein [Candidatus Paceibacterota bacterium]
MAGEKFLRRKIMFYTYVLQSLKDNKLYIGYSERLQERITEHKNGKVIATAKRLPLILVYYEACLNKEKALQREKYFKTGFGRRFLKKRVF